MAGMIGSDRSLLSQVGSVYADKCRVRSAPTPVSSNRAEEAVGQCLWGGGMFLKGLGFLLSETLIYVTAVKGL